MKLEVSGYYESYDNSANYTVLCRHPGCQARIRQVFVNTRTNPARLTIPTSAGQAFFRVLSQESRVPDMRERMCDDLFPVSMSYGRLPATFLKPWYISSKIIAPIIEAKNPACCPGAYQPSARPSHDARRAPPIPISVVMMKPPGSRPGVRSFAIRPTIKPTIMLTKKCIRLCVLRTFSVFKLAPAWAAHSGAISVGHDGFVTCLEQRTGWFYEEEFC